MTASESLLITRAREQVVEEKKANHREKMRAKGKRLIYDCHESMVFDGKVVCPVAQVKHGGFRAGAKDGKFRFIRAGRVEEGIAPSECQKCDRYSGGD